MVTEKKQVTSDMMYWLQASDLDFLKKLAEKKPTERLKIISAIAEMLISIKVPIGPSETDNLYCAAADLEKVPIWEKSLITQFVDLLKDKVDWTVISAFIGGFSKKLHAQVIEQIRGQTGEIDLIRSISKSHKTNTVYLESKLVPKNIIIQSIKDGLIYSMKAQDMSKLENMNFLGKVYSDMLTRRNYYTPQADTEIFGELMPPKDNLSNVPLFVKAEAVSFVIDSQESLEDLLSESKTQPIRIKLSQKK